jgi:hypothetical protein
MATILQFPPRFFTSTARSPQILRAGSTPPQDQRSPSAPQTKIKREPSAQDLAMASQITTAVARIDQEIARQAARTNLHTMPA